MSSTHRSEKGIRGHVVAAAAALLVVLGGCGTGGGGPGGGVTPTGLTPSSPPTSSTSSTPSRPSSPSPTTASDVIVPSSVLVTSLAVKVVGGAYTVDSADSGDYPSAGGLDMSPLGDFVSGDRACRSLMKPHSVEPESFAYVSMSTKTSWFDQVSESYLTVADARTVMTENAAQARGCHTFKVRGDEVVTFRHTVTAVKTPDVDVDVFLHHFNGRSKEWVYEVHLFEGRVGGEVMNIMWASQSFRADPSSVAWTHFQKVVNGYRQDHPRSDGSGSGGVAPVSTAPTRVSASLRHGGASDHGVARRAAASELHG